MKLRKLCRFAALFCIGGGCYNALELLWRGYSHWSMFLAGGSCFHLIGQIGKRRQGKNKAVTAGACALAVTAVEYVCGCIVNLRLKLNVWDYSRMFGNINGQVCLLYTVLWGVLSIAVVPAYKRVYRVCDTLFRCSEMSASVRKRADITTG